MHKLTTDLAHPIHAGIPAGATAQLVDSVFVRERFGIAERNKALASRIIKEAIEEGQIVAYDPAAGPRAIRYVPFWADPDR